MKLREWLKIYRNLAKDLNINESLDYLARDIIFKLGIGKLLNSDVLKAKIKDKTVAVVGLCITKKELQSINEEVVITSGKSIVKVREYDANFVPDVHVTDLEEEEEIIVNLEKNGCILVIHAHGDNIERIRKIVPKLSSFVATTQVQPIKGVYNFGGFTDGDRAAIIAKVMQAKAIKLYGFDFKKVDNPLKRRKMKWAKIVLAKEKLFDIV